MISADSLQATAVAAGDSLTLEQVTHFLEGWHEFYLLAGTAAVTLVGLLFVALSFNLDVLIHESKAHVLAYARSTLLTFSYVLVVSLMELIPGQGTRLIGMMLGLTSLMFGTIHVASTRRRPSSHPTSFERSMRRRTVIYIIGYAVACFTGVAMFVTHAPQLLFNMISVICMMLGNAMGVSWDLLVEVGKLKAEMQRDQTLASNAPRSASAATATSGSESIE